LRFFSASVSRTFWLQVDWGALYSSSMVHSYDFY
jgi:hypothetical protein